MTRERPILFSAPMVRAILKGSKTQTRRVLAPDLFISSGGAVVRMASAGPATTGIREAHCPYWRETGDRLWVRETWALIDANHKPADLATATRIVYRADGLTVPKQRDAEIRAMFAERNRVPDAGMKWRPSIHMPRIASRITLEVTGVRVERLQDISEADAQAEGAPSADLASGRECIFPHQGTHRWGFRLLWESINGSWDANPWVWVLEFRTLERQ